MGEMCACIDRAGQVLNAQHTFGLYNCYISIFLMAFFWEHWIQGLCCIICKEAA